MNTHAVLGPVDPQMGQYPAASLLRVLKDKPVDKVEDRSIVMGDMAEKALRQMKDNVKELLSGRYSEEKVEELSELLSQGTWTHDHPITCTDAEALGLSVSQAMPDDIYQLMNLFPQPVKREPTVEYIPVPRRGQGKAG